ncbi:unnamed protein product [Moneuplotes crassus]|uniref:Uncharacterized protein n=1 Tax=Euplotes crassus TaxID=5936 RepID=A0AAD1UMR7_EUPCR|nr:unnamed protein product [Moneuplotes crassus]
MEEYANEGGNQGKIMTEVSELVTRRRVREEVLKELEENKGAEKFLKECKRSALKDVETLEKSINQDVKALGLALLNSKAKKIYDPENFFDPESSMVINLKDNNESKFMDCVQSLKIPYLRKIELSYILKCKKRFKKLCDSSFTWRIGKTYLSNGGTAIKAVKKLKIKKISKELSQILPKILHHVTFSCFDIDQKQLLRVFSLCRDKRNLIFKSCKLHLGIVPELSKALDRCKISILGFTNCGHPMLTDWVNEPQLFDNLIKGLSKSEDLCKSLTSICLERNPPPISDITKILKKYHLSHINFST